ncbi:MAG: SPFH domain-containing protein [Roseiflexaceae bacterium]|nr:SPFH domain-containing protein [Roseiflexaceae bacterium]
MVIKNPTAASAILGLMFASLLVIYVVVPQNDLVTLLSVVIMAIGLVISFIGDRDEIMLMAGLAGIVSLVAAFFAGQSAFNNIGGIIATIVWGVILITVAQRASNDTVVIPEDHAFMMAPFLSSQAHKIDATIPISSLPFLDRHVATIPTYELTRDVKIAKVNTRSAPDNVDEIEVHIRYQVTDPGKTLRGIPNRGQIQSEVAKEMSVSVSKARLDVAFWEKLLSRQMQAEVDDIVRETLFTEGNAKNMLEAYDQREKLSVDVRRALQKLVERWGVTIRALALNYYVVDKERIGKIRAGAEGFDKEIEREQKKRLAEAVSEAKRIELTGKTTNDRVQELLKKVKELYPDMRSEDVALIVQSVLLSEI